MNKKIIATGTEKKLDFFLVYSLPNGSQEGTCRVEIWQGKPHIVVLTELADNPGMSITNACEHICSHIVDNHGLQNIPVIWIEHYFYEDGRKNETFDLVVFPISNNLQGHFNPPGWRPLSKAAVDQLIGRGGYDGEVSNEIQTR